jgi:hypothetical protein
MVSHKRKIIIVQSDNEIDVEEVEKDYADFFG